MSRDLVINLKVDTTEARRTMREFSIAQRIHFLGEIRAVAEANVIADEMRRQKEAEARENSDRSEACMAQELTTYGSYAFPGLYVAVLGRRGEDYRPDDVMAVLDDYDAISPLIWPRRVEHVAVRVEQAAGTQDVAVRYANIPSTVFRGSILFIRNGAFAHDPTLWAEFLHAIR